MNNDHLFLDELPEYALGTLDTDRARKVKIHLTSCAECRLELTLLEQSLDALAAGVPPMTPPADLEDRLLARMVVRTPLPLRRLLLAALAGALIVTLGVGNLLQWGNTSKTWGSGLALAVLRSVGPVPGAYGSVVFDPERESGVLAVAGLPTGDRYRLWLVRGHEWLSAGTFEVSADGTASLAVALPPGFHRPESFCVSRDEGESYRGNMLLRGAL